MVALLKELETVFTLLRNDWGAVVIALVTDASGESRKARQLFGEKYPWIIVLDCYAHQVNIEFYFWATVNIVLDQSRGWRFLSVLGPSLSSCSTRKWQLSLLPGSGVKHAFCITLPLQFSEQSSLAGQPIILHFGGYLNFLSNSFGLLIWISRMVTSQPVF
jgi:hypothetical protein